MLNRSSVDNVLSDVNKIRAHRRGRGLKVPALSCILDRYILRKRTELFIYLLPEWAKRLLYKRRERWWLELVADWLEYLNYSTDIDLEESVCLLVEKNRQYGSRQLYILDTLGIWLRSVDKVERIQTIDKGVTTKLLRDEPRLDSLKDLFNYAILAVLILRKEVY